MFIFVVLINSAFQIRTIVIVGLW